MKYEFHVDEIEKTGLDVATFLFQNTDLNFQIDKFKNYNTKMIRRPLEKIDLKRLEHDVRNKFQEFGWFGFSKSNFARTYFENRSQEYGGLGITFNPRHWQQIKNPHVHVLGDYRYNLGTVFAGPKGRKLWDELILKNLKDQFYDLAENQGLKKACEFLVSKNLMAPEDVQDCPMDEKACIQRKSNTYSDTLALNHLTPAAQTGYLGEILKTVPRTIVRSRLVELKSLGKAQVPWHMDETLFTCTRVNLPIWSDLNQNILTQETTTQVETGFYFSWDTNRPHKVEVNGIGSRANLVLGITPWFDYEPNSRTWRSNEYYGEAHPQEMFLNNLLVHF